MTWRTNLTWQNAKRRATLITQIRRFFEERSVIEVETPILSQGTVTDVHLDAFSTVFNYAQDSHCDEAKILYLQTSPEFAMKRLIASGFGCCYQISKAFRHEQHGRYHNPEFTMLEWYRIGFDHFQLMDEVSCLLSSVLNCQQAEKFTYQQLFLSHLGFDPLTADIEDLLKIIEQNNMLSDWLRLEDNPDTLLQFIMTQLIEPNIGNTVPCFIYDFPATQASLAKISESDHRVAERFECYYKGVELANGFHELTDDVIQRQRFESDNRQRVALNKPKRVIDEAFLSALEAGLPACAGVAIGIDRLLMLAMGQNHINDVISFNIEKA
jgi:lysyl-tRNA synthetase class 2